MLPPRTLLISFALSLVLHLAFILLVEPFWQEDQEARAFRARLAYQPRFTPPPRLPTPSLTLPRAEMEYLPPTAGPSSAPEVPLPLPTGRLPLDEARPQTELAIWEGVQLRPELPRGGREVLPRPWEWIQVDTSAGATMELLSLADMARADRQRAVVIPDLYSRRDITGYINFTYLRMDGVGGYGTAGRPMLEDLARYIRDYTRILAQGRDRHHNFFLSEELLEDPIHFMFPTARLEGRFPQQRIYVREQERALLEKYLRGGGFLFIDADRIADGRRFLREMVELLRSLLGSDGRLFEIPLSHPIYHSFYDFNSGFRREDKRNILEVEGRPWFYPDRPPCSDVDFPKPRGLWGVQLGDETVAVISDLALHWGWSGQPSPCEEMSEDTTASTEVVTLPYLQAGTNIVVYALNRPGGLAARQGPPAWKPVRPEIPLGAILAEDVAAEVEDSDLFDALGGSLALVRAPLGSRIEKVDLRLKVDGQPMLELLGRDSNGVLVHNLPAGPQRIELEYGGKVQNLEIDLEGGRVLTVGFSLRRLVFLTRLHLDIHGEQVEVEDWLERFSDLQVEEIYLAEEEDY